MKTIYQGCEQLIALGAVHRLGFTVGQVEPAFILARAQDELDELKAAPDDADELADLFGVLIHYAIRKGWTLGQLEASIAAKWERRFTLPAPYDAEAFFRCLRVAVAANQYGGSLAP